MGSVTTPPTISRSGGPSVRAVSAMIREALSVGVPMYNSGDKGGCAEVYRGCLEDILALQGALEGDTRVAAEAVLLKLPSLPSDDKRAWTLRHTLDAILAGGLPPPATPTASPASVKSHSAASAAAAENPAPRASSEEQAPAARLVAHAAPAAGQSVLAASEPKVLFAAGGQPAKSESASTLNVSGGGDDADGKEAVSGGDEDADGKEAKEAAETFGASAEVMDDGWEEELACSICLEFLWDPVKLGCGHSFCRCCLLRTTQLSPDGGRCPNCRAKIDIDPNEAETDQELQASVHAKVPADERLLRQESARHDLEQLRTAQVHTLPVFAMSPGVRPGDPVALNLFEPRYREMASRIMAPEGNKLFVFVGSQPTSGSSGCLVLVERTTTLINGNVSIKGLAMCAVQLDQVWVDQQAHGLFFCKTSSPHVSKVLAQGLEGQALLAHLRSPPREDEGRRQQRRTAAQAAGPSAVGVGGGARGRQRADLPVFFMRGGSCRVGQRVLLNLFEPRYRALAAIVMSTHRLFIFANGEPSDGSSGIVVRVNNCNFRSDGSARIEGRGIEEVTLSRVRTDRTVGNLTHARCELTSLAAVTSLEQGGDDALLELLDDGNEAGAVVRGTVGKSKKCVVM